jgi:hypothetical protein
MNTPTTGAAHSHWFYRGLAAAVALLIAGTVAFSSAHQEIVASAPAMTPTARSVPSTVQQRYLDIKIRQAEQMEQRGYDAPTAAPTPTLAPVQQRYLDAKIRQFQALDD